MSKTSDKKVYRLPPHSLAKILCYKRYLERYLAILALSPFKKIYLLDLFAGEGKDVDGNACSSIAAVQALNEHYLNSEKKCESVVLYLNDSGNSVIEKNVKKIDRVKKFVEEFNLPKNVDIKYDDKTFEELIESLIKRLNKIENNERVVCFIDPFGYKYSKPQTLKDLLANGKTEILLFIPICFMHRFAGKAIQDETFVAGKHIEEFLSVLYENHVPEIRNQIAFIKSIQKRFKEYLNLPYIDVMFIEKEKNQYFALFFFSNNKRGFQKMLEAKWSIDESDGHGFKINMDFSKSGLFTSIDHDDYSFLLYEEIKKRKQMTNQEIFDLGLENNHLPTHSKKVLDQLKADNKIKVLDQFGNPSKGYYLQDKSEKKAIITVI